MSPKDGYKYCASTGLLFRALVLLHLGLFAATSWACVNPTAFGTATAPTNGTPLTISTCTYQSEYNTVNGVVAGATYQVANSCGGYITVRQGTPGGAVVAQGNAPLTFTATVAGTHYIHYNTNAACGTASVCCTTTITCTSCAGSTGCLNTIAFGTAAAPSNSAPLTISTCTFQSEYNTITGGVAGATYQVGNSCGGYITVRQNTFNGPVVAQGNAPLTFTATVSGTHFIHYNTSAACGTGAVCCTTTITCTSCAGSTGCLNTTAFGTVAAPTNATPTTISICSYQNEYSTITGMVAGSTYSIGNSCGGYITVRQGAFNGAVVAQGNAPLVFVAPASGTFFVHWNTNSACGTATNCCTTTITCTSCTGTTGCLNTSLWPLGNVVAPANSTPVIISECSYQSEYSTITGMVPGATYVLGNSCGGYVTVRQGTPNGPVAQAGNAPLTFIPLVGGTYYVHWNTDPSCGTASNCCITTITCTTCIVGGSGGIQIQQDLTPVQLITERFLGQCLTASNVTFTGANVAVGSFSNGWGIGIDEGIIITTGSAMAALGPNISGSTSTTNASGGNALLTNLAGQPTDDAAVFQFTFIPETDEVTFTYVFASEEYPEYVCSSYNDVFGFFISGPGYAPNTNVAQIPGSTLPVAINTVNPGVVGAFGLPGGCASLAYSGLYVNNVGGTHNEYDGFTVPLTVTITTVPCEAYTITIAIADAGDNSFDSAVFLKAQSFSAGVELAISTDTDGDASSPVNCATEGVFVFTLDQPLTQALTLTYLVQQTGTAEYAPAIPIQVTFPAGSTQVVVPVSALPGTLTADLSSVTIVLDTSPYEQFGCTCDPSVQVLTATLYFCDPIALPVRWLSFEAQAFVDERRVECRWETASETNSASFTVERSTDLVSWKEVGSLPGAGNSASTIGYSLSDRSPPRGTIYYRVRQNDIDGSHSHSEVRSVEMAIPQLAAFPNPGPGVFTLEGHAGGQVRVLDMSGRQIPHQLDAAGHLSLVKAAAGSYIVEVMWPSGTAPERLRLVVH